MSLLPLLWCIARAALKQPGSLAWLSLADMAQDVWSEWQVKADAERRAELQRLVELDAEELRQQVEAVVQGVAATEPVEVQQRLANLLLQVPARVRRALPRLDNPQGATDLAALLAAPAEARVTIQLTAGYGSGKEIVCTEPTVLLFGRAKDCRPRYPREGHKSISRHHCLVEINPPDVRIRDLGSLRGTFIDGPTRDEAGAAFAVVEDRKLGGRPKGSDPDARYASPDVELGDGAEVRLTPAAQAAFRVHVYLPARCAACEAAIPDDERGACLQPSGELLCPACRRKHTGVKAPLKTCAWCHRGVTGERGANRPGAFVCVRCREKMRTIISDLARQAHEGDPSLRAIRSYVLGDEIGHGGMGAVYLARHERTGELAAIKLMLPSVAASDRAVALFEREIRNTMALQHRHVVRLLDHGFARGAFFMVLEYCDGGSADRLLAERGGPLPVEEAIDIILQALAGLEYAHQAPLPFVRQKGGGFGPGLGLVHRDIKPGNLFLAGQGSNRVVKIGDYGLAKAFDETGLSGATHFGSKAPGTLGFMCRQQVIDYQHAPATVDIWALAASLYNLLTDDVPRDFPEGRDPWLVVLEDNPVPIRKRNSRVPRKLAALIDRALVEEPDFAFQSAAEFRAALEAAR